MAAEAAIFVFKAGEKASIGSGADRDRCRQVAKFLRGQA
jgi:hypothetical protein